jgi:hypothetical protein
MHEYLARSDGSEGVLFIGRAQEKARIFRALLMFLWVDCHDRPGSGGQSPPRVRSAMAISDSGLW